MSESPNVLQRSPFALVVYRSLGLGLSKSAVLALATVFSASTVASAKTANPKIKLRQSPRHHPIGYNRTDHQIASIGTTMPCQPHQTILFRCIASGAMAVLFALCPIENAYGEQPSLEQIEQWIEELDDDHYIVRETAQQQLTAANKLALSAVAAAAADKNASLESTVRALRILTDWSMSKDFSLRVDALEGMAALKNRPLEAAQATELLADVREQAAIEAIQRLGGTCKPDPRIAGNAQLIQGQARILVQYKGRLPLRVTIGANWKGTDDDLKIITQIRRTYIVSLHSAPVGDGALKHLADIPNLKRVEIYGKNISPAAIAALRKQLPESITIEKRSAARLGIAGDIKLGGAHVVTVLPGSAAANAGLKRGDVITRIEGEQVENFEMLTKHIATHQPGDTVKLVVVRAGKTMTIPVTFDRWGESSKPTKQKTQPR